MDRLWAPWRTAYVRHAGKKQKGCLFCRARASRNDEKNLVFLRTERSMAMLNLYPYNNGHVMIVPARHTGRIELLNEEEILDLFSCLAQCERLLKKILKPQGFNIGVNVGLAAGAGIEEHLHVHMVPRWKGDVNFMPVLTSTKVISQSLSSMYSELKKYAAQHPRDRR